MFRFLTKISYFVAPVTGVHVNVDRRLNVANCGDVSCGDGTTSKSRDDDHCAGFPAASIPRIHTRYFPSARSDECDHEVLVRFVLLTNSFCPVERLLSHRSYFTAPGSVAQETVGRAEFCNFAIGDRVTGVTILKSSRGDHAESSELLILVRIHTAYLPIPIAGDGVYEVVVTIGLSGGVPVFRFSIQSS